MSVSQTNQHTNQPSRDSTLPIATNPVAQKLDFDMSPGLTNRPLTSMSKLFLKKAGKGLSDSYLSKPVHRTPHFTKNEQDEQSIQLSGSEEAEKSLGSFFLSLQKSKSFMPQGEKICNKLSIGLCNTFGEDKIEGIEGSSSLIRSGSQRDAGNQKDFSIQNCSSGLGRLNLQDLKEGSCDNKDILEPCPLVLPTCQNLRDPDLNTISTRTLLDLMENPKKLSYLIVDCRYDYEFEGGHIKGAVNITSPEMLQKVLFEHRNLMYNPAVLEEIKKDPISVLSNPKQYAAFGEVSTCAPPIIIFHCEFSQKRGPRAFRALRNMDRQINASRWPHLFYPQIYVLEGGYRQFHADFPVHFSIYTHCNPENGYIEMRDSEHKTDYANAREMELKLWKKKSSILENLKSLHNNDLEVLTHPEIVKND